MYFRLDDFPNEPILWKEIENFTPILCMDTACLSEEQAFFQEMFSALPLGEKINISVIQLILLHFFINFSLYFLLLLFII